MAKAVIAIHGGAGAITRAAMSAEKEQHYRQQLAAIVSAGQRMLARRAVARWTRSPKRCACWKSARCSMPA